MVDAMAQGHKAAEAIDAYLRGTKMAPAATAHRAQAETASNPKPDAPKQRARQDAAGRAGRAHCEISPRSIWVTAPEQAMAEASGAWRAACAASACSA
jgi:hypothetical protein